MSDYVPPMPSRFSRKRLTRIGMFTIFFYGMIFVIFGWPNMRVGSKRLADGTRYAEYVGLGGYEYLVYEDHQSGPPLFILQSIIFQSSELKRHGVDYEIKKEQPE